MAKRVGYKQLAKMLEDDEIVHLPWGVTAFALAKSAYMQRCMNEGWDGWWDDEYRLYDAFGDMLTFISSSFIDGGKWVTDNTLMAEPESSAYRLFEILDQKGVFSKASRILMDFVVRGQTTMIRKRRNTTKYKQDAAF